MVNPVYKRGMSLVVSPTAPLLVLRERVRQQNATVGTDIRNLGLLPDADISSFYGIA